MRHAAGRQEISNLSESESLPRQGRLPEPASPEEARELLSSEAFPAPGVQRVVMEAHELTSICPRSGQPDFGSVLIEYSPGDRCLESKALKVYLWSFRDEPAFCEALAARIADDVVDAIAPREIRVEVRQNVRGGIGIVAVAERASARLTERTG